MKYIASLVFLFLLSSCMTPTERLNRISIGMVKGEVAAILGEPVSTASQGRTEIFSYRLSTPEQRTWTGGSSEYYVRFVDGCVESFGRKGDFDSTKNPMIEVKTDSKVKIDSSGDLYTELKKLDELKKQGIITDQEFDTQKAKLLNR
jgi:outer membrane protein assembly factor BamE (lipoprotein component of BamABCDE complex)